jgi:K+-transporting ATPase A subunit
MTTASVLQYVLFLIVVTLLVRLSGVDVQRVFERQHTWLDPLVSPLERGICRLTGVDPGAQMLGLAAQSSLAGPAGRAVWTTTDTARIAWDPRD